MYLINAYTPTANISKDTDSIPNTIKTPTIMSILSLL